MENLNLEKKIDLVLKEIREIKQWRDKIDRGIEGEPLHGNPSYIERIIANQEEIGRVSDNVRGAHMRIDKIIYITVGVGAGAGGVTAGIFKVIFGI